MRSFIAIELPETARSALESLQGELKKCGADIRWVRPEHIHLTLKFLGDIKEKDVAGIAEDIKGTCSRYPAFKLAISRMGVFPNTKSPRVLWVGLDNSGVLSGIYNEIEAGMASLGFERENRRFVPHLTLGRFRSPRGKDGLLEKMETCKNSEFGLIEVNSVSLMRSDPGPEGAKYTRLADFRLHSRDR